ncbi:oxidoreductase [Zobellella denitrificans]|jgi:3-hydroxyisobutyrate dehydrogenase|uniref:Oxidoreductase n=2 Tax=Zobellella denitrificans TaxID=347534 RepID=A0A231N231_9GAMM|nr:NAD(P)-dependent oxidoreductase [Zobellella denitrificans]ATG73825.1 oxidoreductase [Zobellella denitrificans]OXS16561.1 oxidoreductase [Zobellella denitrificans]
MNQLAFIGLGSMGLPMARNLLSARFPVAGFDMNPRALAALADAGGRVCDSARDAARGADALILMVVNATQAEQILFDEGALESLADDALVVLMATCPSAAVARLAERVAAVGRQLVDAPVSGGVVGARARTLSIMAAAPAAVFERIFPVLRGMGDKVFHVGEEPGQGAVVKTVNQLLCGVHIAAVAEAFSLARKAGVDLQVLLEIMSGSAAASWMLKDRGPRMLRDDPEVTSAIDIFVKDLGIVLASGSDSRVALPLAAAAHQMFLATAGRGLGQADDSQVIQSYDLINGNCQA